MCFDFVTALCSRSTCSLVLPATTDCWIFERCWDLVFAAQQQYFVAARALLGGVCPTEFVAGSTSLQRPATVDFCCFDGHTAPSNSKILLLGAGRSQQRPATTTSMLFCWIPPTSKIIVAGRCCCWLLCNWISSLRLRLAAARFLGHYSPSQQSLARSNIRRCGGCC